MNQLVNQHSDMEKFESNTVSNLKTDTYKVFLDHSNERKMPLTMNTESVRECFLTHFPSADRAQEEIEKNDSFKMAYFRAMNNTWHW